MGIAIREDAIKNKEIPDRVENGNSLFVILGNSGISQNRMREIPGVIHDIANLKRLFLSENIGFNESNILTLLNAEKQEIIRNLNKSIQMKTWDNIVLYYSGFGATNQEKEFYITCCDSDYRDKSTCITAQEIGLTFEKINSNIILIFDCCHAQRAFKYLYNKDVFLLGAVSESEVAQDTLDGGLFTKNLVDILKNGINNNKDTLSLNDIYLELRKKLINIQEPEMLTTNIVQHQLLSKNQFQFSQQKIQESIKLKSKTQIRELISTSKLKEAFQQLTILVSKHDESLKNKLTLFENRFTRLRDEVILGLISHEASNIENNQIVNGLLYLMGEI